MIISRSIGTYPQGSGLGIFVNLNQLCLLASRLLFPLFDQALTVYTRVEGTDFVDTLSDAFGLESLEEKFGGPRPNLESNFFPP